MSNSNKFELQDNLYQFPYHYIPHFETDGTPSLMRKLNWGFDYLCYQKHLQEKVVAMHPQSVLEVGCGDGYFISGLPSSIPVRVGVDLSSKSIAFARAFHPDCTFFAQDFNAIKDTFDIVAAIEVIEHIQENELPVFFNSLCHRTNNSGTIIISVPTTNIPLNKKHYRHYTIDLLKNQLADSQAGLSIKEYEYIFRKPWWYNIFRRFFNNKVFSLEFKPFMRFAWRDVWRNYRIADEGTGFHLVAVLTNKKIL
ncbi:class I SAM-dependent DNA methyltransferase [Desulfonatronum lacustre]|uniref:class I SAM-dependent DNA methyltransferase n=1 Tax=Desulfonatronum lacustre TaxID=66849 RepID=UPI00048AF141|nr:class I SAM-dependent methyltransferase [Desulfonatronum lacustre]